MLDYLDSLAAMEPSHQTYNVRGARALAEAVRACRRSPALIRHFIGRCRRWRRSTRSRKDARDLECATGATSRISYDYISRQVPEVRTPGARRVIAAHLGGGTSMCAMLDGRSVDTTMGFAGGSGLPMATRSGDRPPGALFYLLRRKLFDDESLEKMLYERAGLLGLSGISGDMRVLQESTDSLPAVAAMDFFVYAMTKYAGAYRSARRAGCLRVLPLGIGENCSTVRAALCRKLEWLGVRLDKQTNASNGPLHPGQPRVGVGHPHQRGTDDRTGAPLALVGDPV